LRVNGKEPSFAPKKQDREPFYIFVDEAEFKRAGTKLLALAMSVSQHKERIFQDTREVLEAETQDFWAAGNINALRKKGLHFADATETGLRPRGKVSITSMHWPPATGSRGGAASDLTLHILDRDMGDEVRGTRNLSRR
jgi:hypothetical protein